MEKIIKLFSVLLVLSSLALLVFIYYPLISLYFYQPEVDLSITEGFYITIPKIKAQAPIIEEVDPWDSNNYTEALKKGVALSRGFSKPGEKGIIYMFAHSSLPPWEMTRNNVAFLKLNELEKGDEILISENGKNFTYIVFDKKEFWPNEVNELKKVKGDVLILQTCTPIGTDLKRLLVFAKEIS